MNKLKYFLCILCVVLFSLISICTNAQTSQISLKGRIQDTANLAIPAATIMLLNSTDSALINYTTSNSNGEFTFRNIKNTNYILKISHITFMPWQKHIKQSEEKEMDLGTLTMYPIAEFLMEVVIRDAKAPIFIKGDTVEYDATTFKVPPGSTVEDLLRRLPGIDVDASGNISTMGKDVRTVYVDGKTFFGNDPTTVTQNLDAASVKKVQVFNEKSEQEKLTGISDGTKEKVMNLELKDEYKKGYFGKATAAYGTSDRWAGRGNFNWFNEHQQLSFIGYANNINQTQLNWSDYSEFKGQSMTMGYDNGDFGFSSGGGRYYSYSFGEYFDGSGFTENYGGGLNYNYFNKKVKFNTGYFYKKNDAISERFTKRQTYLTDSIYNTLDTLKNINNRNTHSFSTRAEYDIDSSNSVIFKASIDFSGTESKVDRKQLYQTSDFNNINLNTILNTTEYDKYNINTLAIYRHKFKKKGRTFAVSGSYDLTNNDEKENINNLNEFYRAQTLTEQINSLRILNDEKNHNQQIKSSLLYVEPLSRRISLMGFYNFKTESRELDNKSTNPLNSQSIDSLKLNYQNNILYNRIGTSLNYGYEGINVSLGGAFQSILLEGISETYNIKKDKWRYNNFIPYSTVEIEFPNDIYFETSYSYNIDEPSISYLFPIPNLTNPLFITLGNPELSPERSHEIDGRLSYWSSASMTSVSLSVSNEIYDNRIVYNQKTEFVDSLGYKTIYIPENVKGGNDWSLYSWASFPIIKTKLSMNINPSYRTSKSPTFINGVENITNSKTYSGRIGFSLTIGPKLSFYLSGGVSSTNMDYSIQKDRNQKYMNYSSNASVKWQLFKKTFFEGNFDFNNYNNKSFDFNQNIQTLNLSIRQLLGEKNKFEVRLAAFDLLNQQQNISQSARVNYVEYRKTLTLARYFMLSVSYNLKGFDTSNSRRGFM